MVSNKAKSITLVKSYQIEKDSTQYPETLYKTIAGLKMGVKLYILV